MNRPSPYAGYGGPPPRPSYGGPSQHAVSQPPPPQGGMGGVYGAGPYGMPSGPPPFAQGPPPPMMGQGHYGGDAFRPPMPNGPLPPHQQGGGGGYNNPPLPSYGSPIHFAAGPPSGPRPPMQPPRPMAGQGRMMSGPQKRTFDDHSVGGPSSYGNGPHGAAPQAGYENGQNQGRKRSRVGDGADGADGGPSGDQSYAEYLEERLARERPCRTLFVRNIDFTTSVGELRSQFESFGEIKTWFDLIQKRGIAFITYFDIRAAEAARNALQGARFGVRGLDVHFSLPRESEMTKRCDRDKDQGTLFIVLKRAPDDLNDQEIAQLFAPFGEIKNLRPYKDQANCRFIEFWDCRATKAAHDAIINSTYRGGTWDVKFAWDQGVQERLPDMAKHDRDRERLSKIGGGGGGGQGAGHNAAGGGQRNRGSAQSPDLAGGQSPAMRRWGQAQGVITPQQQQQQPSNGYGPGAGSPPTAHNAPGYGPSGQAAGQSYASPTPPTSGAAPNAGDPNRLEQAQKVQQLLASLKNTAGGGNAATLPASSPASAPSNPAAPSLPSNIAALLQLAQSKAAGSSK